jgi:hypothetical protein
VKHETPSGGDRRWFKRSARDKRPVTRDNITVIIIILIIITIILTIIIPH